MSVSRFNAQIGENALPIRPFIEKGFATILLFFSLFIFFSSRYEDGFAASLRMALSDGVVPVIEAISAPAQAVKSVGTYIDDLFFVFHKNRELKLENSRLMQWHHTAQALAIENESLRNLMGYHPEHANAYISAKVIGNMGSNLSHSLLINAGAEQGVKPHQAVINEYGLIGRTIEVGKNSARILLMTDINSRIPISIEPSGIKTILAGDRSNMPQLHFVDAKSSPELGAQVVTASDGGVFPAGLPIGRIFSKSEDGWFIKPYADTKRIGFVRVVDFAGYGSTVNANQP